MSNLILETLTSLPKKIREFYGINKQEKEILYLAAILSFCILARILPFELISIILTLLLFVFIFSDFYLYVNTLAKKENKNENTIVFSWGYVKEKVESMDLNNFFSYLASKDVSFYKTYFMKNLHSIIIYTFVFGDLVVALKNLSFYDSGIYFSISIFCKFVFLGFLYLRNSYLKIREEGENREKIILDIFYAQMNGLLSVFFVIFILFFTLSKFLVEIFFGSSYMPFQASLPFILVANMTMVLALCVFKTAEKIDLNMTKKICKIYITLFTILFVFMTINYIDTIAYFVVGAASILSIFLYNLVIKKPSYIESTYNLSF